MYHRPQNLCITEQRAVNDQLKIILKDTLSCKVQYWSCDMLNLLVLLHTEAQFTFHLKYWLPCRKILEIIYIAACGIRCVQLLQTHHWVIRHAKGSIISWTEPINTVLYSKLIDFICHNISCILILTSSIIYFPFSIPLFNSFFKSKECQDWKREIVQVVLG